jgi:hypothetical protein
MRFSKKEELKEKQLLDEIHRAIQRLEDSKKVWETAMSTRKPFTYLSLNPAKLSEMTTKHLLFEIVKTLSNMENDGR